MESIYTCAVAPAFELLPEAMGTNNAAVMILAIGYMETAYTARRQYGNGPARGFWQMEPGATAGFRGVFNHSGTFMHARTLAASRGYHNWSLGAMFERLEHDDIFAAGMARLLLWTDPYRLPTNAVDGFAAYIRTWRPGAYARGSREQQEMIEARWLQAYKLAIGCVRL